MPAVTVHGLSMTDAIRKAVMEDCEDDGEHGASRRILRLLQEKDMSNVMVIITRWKGGPDLGKRRFHLIEEATKQALVKK